MDNKSKDENIEIKLNEANISKATLSKASLLPKRENVGKADVKKDKVVSKAIFSKASLLPKRKSVVKKNVTKEKKVYRKNHSFGSKPIDFSKFVFMPEGYEALFLALYFLLIPYIAGLIFLFFFVAQTSITNFTTFNITTFVIVWAIGYEIVATILLILIFHSAFTSKSKVQNARVRSRY